MMPASAMPASRNSSAAWDDQPRADYHWYQRPFDGELPSIVREAGEGCAIVPGKGRVDFFTPFLYAGSCTILQLLT